MFSPEERNAYFLDTMKALEASLFVEGVIQLGSGVYGYKDEHSDIDLMVATSRIEDVGDTNYLIQQILRNYTPILVKEKQLSKHISLVIAILQNKLEFNVSIVPTPLLSVKSPLWKVVFDKTGSVTEKMNAENRNFLNKAIKYIEDIDVVFEFVYCTISLEKELKRNNVIYAIKMLEQMREYTLLVQAMNEDKKLHQFKAYETLHPSFISEYLSTYPVEVSSETLRVSGEKVKKLFVDTVKRSSIFTIDSALYQLLLGK